MCSKAEGWKRSGTVAAIHTAALSDVPEDEYKQKPWFQKTVIKNMKI